MSGSALVHHVERSLRVEFDLDSIEPDEDGDYVVFGGGSIVWVRPLLDTEPAMVRVWTMAATEVKPTAALLREVNDINLGLRQLRCVVSPGKIVVIDAELEIESLEPGQLRRLVTGVGEIAEQVGELVTTVYGGRRPFAPCDEESEGADIE